MSFPGPPAAGAQHRPPSRPGLPGLQNLAAIGNAAVIEHGSLPPNLRIQGNSAVAQAGRGDPRQLLQAIETIPAAIIAVARDEHGALALIARESI